MLHDRRRQVGGVAGFTATSGCDVDVGVDLLRRGRNVCSGLRVLKERVQTGTEECANDIGKGSESRVARIMREGARTEDGGRGHATFSATMNQCGDW